MVQVMRYEMNFFHIYGEMLQYDNAKLWVSQTISNLKLALDIRNSYIASQCCVCFSLLFTLMHLI